MTGLQLFNIFVVCANLMAALSMGLLLLLYNSAIKKVFPFSHGIVLYVASLGLMAQAYRNYKFLEYGISPTDNTLQFWVLKDAGYWIMTIDLLLVLKRIKKPNARIT